MFVFCGRDDLCGGRFRSVRKDALRSLALDRCRPEHLALRQGTIGITVLMSEENGNMRASYYHGNRTFRTGSAAMPAPGAAEALLRVRRVGICGTDLHIYQGNLDHRIAAGGLVGTEDFTIVL